MNSNQITKILRKLPVPGAVYPSDQLPAHIHFPSALICNTDPQDEPGEHWIAICFDKQGQGEYFDPYGLQPFPPFIPFMNSCSSWKYNDVCLQSPLSQTCGQHCLTYLIHRCQGIDMNTYVQRFSNDLMQNDVLVSKFIQSL